MSTAIGLTIGGSSTVHIYTQTILKKLKTKTPWPPVGEVSANFCG